MVGADRAPRSRRGSDSRHGLGVCWQRRVSGPSARLTFNARNPSGLAVAKDHISRCVAHGRRDSRSRTGTCSGRGSDSRHGLGVCWQRRVSGPSARLTFNARNPSGLAVAKDHISRCVAHGRRDSRSRTGTCSGRGSISRHGLGVCWQQRVLGPPRASPSALWTLRGLGCRGFTPHGVMRTDVVRRVVDRALWCEGRELRLGFGDGAFGCLSHRARAERRRGSFGSRAGQGPRRFWRDRARFSWRAGSEPWVCQGYRLPSGHGFGALRGFEFAAHSTAGDVSFPHGRTTMPSGRTFGCARVHDASERRVFWQCRW